MSDTPQAPPAQLAAALAAAMAECKAVGKDGEVRMRDGGRYRYASAEAIMTEAQSALSRHGLVVMPTGQRYVRQEMPREEAPSPYGRGMVEAEFILIHSSGESMDLGAYCMPYVMERGRAEDKAVATAITFILKYLLRGLLCMPKVDEDEEPDARPDEGHGSPAHAQGAAAADEPTHEAEDSPCTVKLLAAKEVHKGESKRGPFSIWKLNTTGGDFKLFDATASGARGLAASKLVGQLVTIEWAWKEDRGYRDRDIKDFGAAGISERDVRDDEIEVMLTPEPEMVPDPKDKARKWWKLRNAKNGEIYWTSKQPLVDEAVRCAAAGLHVRMKVHHEGNQVFVAELAEAPGPAPAPDAEVPF